MSRKATFRPNYFVRAHGKSKPQAVQEAIYQHVLAVASSPKRLSKKEIETQGIELGCLWAQALCERTGWQWRAVKYPSGKTLFALVNQDRSLITAPLHSMQDQLKKRGQNAEITTLLLYNMIVGGDVPEARPKGYLLLG